MALSDNFDLKAINYDKRIFFMLSCVGDTYTCTLSVKWQQQTVHTATIKTIENAIHLHYKMLSERIKKKVGGNIATFLNS